MPQVRVTAGVLTVESLDSPLAPDAGLPPGGLPGHDLPSGGHPWVPGHLPDPPPNIWPPLTVSAPIQPTPPGILPGTIWPPVGSVSPPIAGTPGHPDTGLRPSPGRPSTGLPPDPARPDAGLPSGGAPDTGLPAKTYWVVAGIPGVGWRYVAVDPSLTVSPPMAPTATPRRA